MNKSLEERWAKILSLMRIRHPMGGLEISDSALRYAKWDGANWTTVSLRLPPEVLAGGRIKDRGAFVETLKSLRAQIPGGRKSEKLDVVVALGSLNIYSQVFSLPHIKGQDLEKAVELNLQMASPDRAEQAYSGWQVIREDMNAGRLEIVSAFVAKAIVDELGSALGEAGFMPHSLEPRAFSIARTVRSLEAGFDPEASYLVMQMDEEGMEFLVLRKKELYFQYFTSWRDVLGDDREISEEKFNAALARSFSQVFNFYTSHWGEPLAGVFVSAGGLKDKVWKTLETFSLPLREIQLRGVSAGPEWLVALGSALRGYPPHSEDTELSLLGMSAQEEFREHQVLGFVEFWKLLLPAALGILFIPLIISDVFLHARRAEIEKSSAAVLAHVRTDELATLQARLENFNRSVLFIRQLSDANPPEHPAFKMVFDLAKTHTVTPDRLVFRGGGQAELCAIANSKDAVSGFEAELKSLQGVTNVSTPLAEIRNTTQGGVSFRTTFQVAPTPAP